MVKSNLLWSFVNYNKDNNLESRIEEKIEEKVDEKVENNIERQIEKKVKDKVEEKVEKQIEKEIKKKIGKEPDIISQYNIFFKLNQGYAMGLISGIINTLGIIISLYSGMGTRLPIMIGILSVAVTDGLSHGLGMYFGKMTEASLKLSLKIGLSAFMSTFVISLSFLIPYILPLKLGYIILINILYGLILVWRASGKIFKNRKQQLINTGFIIMVIFISFIIGSTLKKNLT